ncbi:hypothetical protein [Mesorhizobium qingshengii]|uniref:Uncharacterized protein n=1 Tax=Mesorhizobium qingshengii TaxID=1165689 RepID=A0A1G5ZXB0_9HYPH|nr:hypothetical protein [Mesorhizobium qingshengii]SDA99126.1 hypothetical protein SAMN02927914_06465 [Mesorhizobium qingshengii]
MAQELAVITNAQEEYIFVFMASVLVTIVLISILFPAQFTADPLTAVGQTGMWLLIVFVTPLVLLVALTLYTDSSRTAVNRDIPMVLGLGLPVLLTILVQWVFVRWRVKRDMIGGKAS